MGQVKNEGHEILRVLCGSRAYGLHDESSDYDYHGVYVVPTRTILGLNGRIKETAWVEGEGEDNTAWEIGHFLRLAVHCNPTVLETFVAPVEKSSAWGDTVRKLFPHVLARKRIYDAFRGYGMNQRKKMLDDRVEEPRQWKFAVAHLRVLHHGIELLSTGTYHTALPQDVRDFLHDVKAGNLTRGQVIDAAQRLEARLEAAYDCSTVREEPDLERVNFALLHIREAYWNIEPAGSSAVEQ